eukprot:g2372.t1
MLRACPVLLVAPGSANVAGQTIPYSTSSGWKALNIGKRESKVQRWGNQRSIESYIERFGYKQRSIVDPGHGFE